MANYQPTATVEAARPYSSTSNKPMIQATTSPYGDYDTVIQALADQLSHGDYLLGDTLTAADLLWGTALKWTTNFGIVPKLPVITAYIDRVCGHPACVRAGELDEALAATMSGKAQD